MKYLYIKTDIIKIFLIQNTKFSHSEEDPCIGGEKEEGSEAEGDERGEVESLLQLPGLVDGGVGEAPSDGVLVQ